MNTSPWNGMPGSGGAGSTAYRFCRIQRTFGVACAQSIEKKFDRLCQKLPRHDLDLIVIGYLLERSAIVHCSADVELTGQSSTQSRVR